MHGVNITILSASGMINAAIDTSPPTPGIILSGCHETQLDKNELQTSDGMVDPWVYSIIQVIKTRALRKRGIPTYTVLFHEAKKYLKKQLDEKQYALQHHDPNLNDMQPWFVPETNLSNDQDPQMIFDQGYIDPDTQRFLRPLAAVENGGVTGDLLRYPRDEL